MCYEKNGGIEVGNKELIFKNYSQPLSYFGYPIDCQWDVG